MHVFWLGLAGGAAAFAHCLGMCGGFALHLSRSGRRREVLARQMLWHGGKTTTYVFLGALAGFAGHWIGSGPGGGGWAQDLLAYAAGGVMVVAGLSLLGAWPRRFAPGAAGEGILAPVFRHAFGAPSAPGALGLGLMTGFLPCPIVYGFLALAAQSRSVTAGMLAMAGLGLGTLWSLLLLGLTGQAIARRVGRWGPAVGGAVLVLLGAATALRGTEAFHHLLGCPAGAHGGATGAGAEPRPGCCGGH